MPLLAVLKEKESPTDETMTIVRESGILDSQMHLSVMGAWLCDEIFEEIVLAIMLAGSKLPLVLPRTPYQQSQRPDFSPNSCALAGSIMKSLLTMPSVPVYAGIYGAEDETY